MTAFAVILHDTAGVQFLDGPRWREAAARYFRANRGRLASIGDLMTWKIKAKGAKQTTEVISDDPKYAIFKLDQWRSQGLEVWIEDINGNKVDEAALKKAADQTSPHAPPLNYKFD